MPDASTSLLPITAGFVGGIALAFLMPPFLRGVVLVSSKIGMTAQPTSHSDKVEHIWGEDWSGTLLVGIVACLSDILFRHSSVVDIVCLGLTFAGMAAGSHVTWRIWNKRTRRVRA